MIAITWTKEMLESAQAKARKLGEINNSITGGRGNLAGYLGEEAVANHIGAEIVSSHNGREKYDYDLIKDGKRVEVKTKRRTVQPRDDYDVSVAITSEHQRPDIYIFVSLQFERSEGQYGSKVYYGLKNIWLLGMAEPYDYFTRAKLWKKGDQDSSNGFVTHSDMYNLAISDITPVEEAQLIWLGQAAGCG